MRDIETIRREFLAAFNADLDRINRENYERMKRGEDIGFKSVADLYRDNPAWQSYLNSFK